MNFSEILNAIGLLGAKLIFFIRFRIAICFNILKACSNNQNVLFNIFMTIFDWHLYACAINKFSYQTILDRLEFERTFSIQNFMD